jgi:hypothetical protein
MIINNYGSKWGCICFHYYNSLFEEGFLINNSQCKTSDDGIFMCSFGAKVVIKLSCFLKNNNGEKLFWITSDKQYGTASLTIDSCYVDIFEVKGCTTCLTTTSSSDINKNSENLINNCLIGLIVNPEWCDYSYKLNICTKSNNIYVSLNIIFSSFVLS